MNRELHRLEKCYWQCLDRGVFTYSYEFPFLYDLAVSKGFSRQKADSLLGEMWLSTTKQYIKMLMFSEIYRPSIEGTGQLNRDRRICVFFIVTK